MHPFVPDVTIWHLYCSTSYNYCFKLINMSRWRTPEVHWPCNNEETSSLIKPQATKPLDEAATHPVLAPVNRWSRGRALTVDPAVGAVLPVLQFMLAKPQVDLLPGALHRVAAVNHVPTTQRKQKIAHVSQRFIVESFRGVSCIHTTAQ